MTTRNTYNGGKGGAGVWQTIIGQQPPHRRYCEPFLGYGAVLRHKKPADDCDYGCDIDDKVYQAWHERGWTKNRCISIADGLNWLDMCEWGPGDLIYLDPPYLHETRARTKLYRHELSDSDHARLLDLARHLGCMVQISGYRSALYDAALSDWRRLDFQAMTRRGLRTESLWMNYPAPAVLHDIRFAGANYRERERIKRLRTRWAARFARMPALEQQAIAEALIAAGTVPLTLAVLDAPQLAPAPLALRPSAPTAAVSAGTPRHDRQGGTTPWVKADECVGHGRGGTGRCCDQAGKYNGYGSDGPTIFTCPRGCSCHD